MFFEIVDSDGARLWQEGEDYSTFNRSLVAAINIREDDGSLIGSYTPTDSQSAHNVLFRRRTIMGQGTKQVVYFFGFPANIEDEVYFHDGSSVSTITFDSANAIIAPIQIRDREYGSYTPPPTTELPERGPVLNLSAPTGATVVNSGESVSNAVSNAGNNSRVFIRNGTYSGGFSPRPGQEIWGESSSVVITGGGNTSDGALSSAEGVRLRNLTLRGFTRNACGTQNSKNWTIEHLLIFNNPGKGSNFSNGAQAYHSIVRDNGGFGTDGGHNAESRPTGIYNCLYRNNNSSGGSGNNPANIKLYSVDGHGFEMEDSDIEEANGHGFWLDTNWGAVETTRNLDILDPNFVFVARVARTNFTGNHSSGVFLEAGRGCHIYDGCTFTLNDRTYWTDQGLNRPIQGAGIRVVNAADLLIEDFEVRNNDMGIYLFNDSNATRPKGYTVPHTENVMIRNGTIHMSRGKTGFYVSGDSGHWDSRDIAQFDNIIYDVPSGNYFVGPPGETDMNLSQWKALDMVT